MRQIDQAEPLHPLGEPTNRKPDTGLTLEGTLDRSGAGALDELL